MPSIPFALSLSKPVLSDAAGGVEGGRTSFETEWISTFD
jgi:hypothetical protein